MKIKLAKTNLLTAVLLALVTINSINAVDIPTSSLEPLRQQAQTNLDKAKAENNASDITKYQAEVDKLDKSIKDYKVNWLEFEKRKNETKLSTASEADKADINKNIQDINSTLQTLK